MQCPACEQVIQANFKVCPYCQALLNQNVNPYSTPTAVVQTVPENQGDVTGGVIPYKNPKALLAYYLGILSGLPLIGLPFGVAAFIFGILGLRDRKKNPAIKGSAHAWVGIGCGGVFILFWGAVIALLITAALVR